MVGTVGAAEAVENGETVEEREGTGEAREGAKGPCDGNDPPAHRTVRWRRLVTGALIAVLVMAGAGLLLRAQQLRDTPTTANHALTDAENTTRVAGDVSSALSKVFSYSPKDTAVTEEAAKRLLAGKALQQYAALFGQVEKEATDQRLTLTTHVVRAGVTRLSDRGAHLLVFLDQVYERQGKAATTAAAQLSVTAELRDGHWRIVDITSG
ncbi:hypothetical protein ACPXCE_02100 [Streptomyces sp. DT24]|uniref:hypothetical protein n=1 Tax=Streptomyces sp. DT24 TaxID=3416520 RepID=UPI003CEFFCB5